jgi:protein ImuA
VPALLEQLSHQIRALELGGRRKSELPTAISSGCQELDGCLPDGGYAPGTIIEWIEPTFGCGGIYLAIAAARQAMADGKYLVVIDPQQRFYPPAAQAMGIPIERLIVLRPDSESDLMWSIDQALRCSAVGAVVAHLERVSELQARRFQLAAEQGQALGCWLRPWKIQRAPSWAEIQWLVQPVSNHPSRFSGKPPNVRRIGLESLRMRGGVVGRRWTLAIDTQSGRITMEKPHAITSSLCLATQLAMPKSECDARRRAESATIRAASA